MIPQTNTTHGEPSLARSARTIERVTSYWDRLGRLRDDITRLERRSKAGHPLDALDSRILASWRQTVELLAAA